MIRDVQERLEKLGKWQRGEDGGSRDVFQGANLRGADLDFSCWPLWCGSLRAKADDRTLSLAQHSEISAELKDALNTPALIQQANRFHWVRECGRLEMWEEGDHENHG